MFIYGLDMLSNPVAHERFGDGPVSNILQGGGGLGMRFDPGLMRPYIEDDPNSPMRGRPVVTLDTGRRKKVQVTNAKGQKSEVWQPVFKPYLIRDLEARGIRSPVFNATSLRKESWIELDRKILRAARYILTVWDDLKNANSFGGFNAMGKTILEHETMTDPGAAQVDMEALTEGRGDSPQFQLQGLPLPITHSDFWYSTRRLAESQNSGMPLSTISGEASGRRVAESIEKTTLGNSTGITYGGNSTQQGGYSLTSQVYGYLNYVNRLTATNLYAPTGLGRSGSGWVPADTLKDILGIMDQLRFQKFRGPFMVYTSNDWDQYLDNDYILTGGNVATQTLRERLRRIQGISDIKRADMLFSSLTPDGINLATRGPGTENLNGVYPFTMLFVQLTAEVAEAVNGMDITTIQWEPMPMKTCFKVMAIQVPRLRSDAYGNCGILQATFNHA